MTPRPRAAYRVSLTSAVSKSPWNVVCPFGEAEPAAGSAMTAAIPGSVSVPAIVESDPLANDNLAAAGSSEYGGPAVVVAASTTRLR